MLAPSPLKVDFFLFGCSSLRCVGLQSQSFWLIGAYLHKYRPHYLKLWLCLKWETTTTKHVHVAEKSGKAKQLTFRALPLLLVSFADIEKVWRGCEADLFGWSWLGCVEYTAGLWTFDSVTTLLLICCTCGLWTAPGMTVAGETCWKICCWPAVSNRIRTWHCKTQTKENKQIKYSAMKIYSQKDYYIKLRFTWNDCNWWSWGIRGPKRGNKVTAIC